MSLTNPFQFLIDYYFLKTSIIVQKIFLHAHPIYPDKRTGFRKQLMADLG